jgi:hypothetical protein
VPSGHWPTNPTLRGGLGSGVVRLHDHATVGGQGAIRALEWSRPAGGGDLFCEALGRGRDGRYGKQRQSGQQGDDVPVWTRRSVGESASR